LSNRKKKEILRKQTEAKKKKIIIGIIATLVIIAVAIGTILVISNFGKGKDNKSEPTAPPVAGNIVEDKVENITKVQISNGEITYTVNNNVGFEVEGYESKFLQNTDLAIQVFPSAATVPYVKKIEKVNSLSDYGLENTDKSVTVIYNDGTEFKLLLGNRLSDFEYYAMTESDGSVYTIPAEVYENLMKHPGEYRDKFVCSLDDETVKNFTIHKNGKKEVTVEIDENFVPTNNYQTTSYMVTYPYSNKNAALGVLQYMFENIPDEIVAEDIVEENPSNLSSYGLSPAVLSLTITDGLGTTTLKIGNETDGKVYLMCNDSPVVYLVESPLYNAIKDFKAADYVEGFIGLHNIADVSSINITKGEKSYSMKLIRDNDFTNYMINDIVVKEKEFKQLYQSVIAVSAKDFVQDTPEGEVYAEITYNFTDNTSIAYKYYNYDENYCIVKAMNDLTGLVSKEDIDGVIESFTKEN